MDLDKIQRMINESIRIPDVESELERMVDAKIVIFQADPHSTAYSNAIEDFIDSASNVILELAHNRISNGNKANIDKSDS